MDEGLQVKCLLRSDGVIYTPFALCYLWLLVRYCDLSTEIVEEAYIAVLSSFFSVNVSMQWQLKAIVQCSDWQWLQEKYGFELGITSKYET